MADLADLTDAPARVLRPRAGGRARQIAGEAGRLVVSLWFLLTATFFMIHLVPGDPARASLGAGAPADLVEARRHALGLDRSLVSQYVDYFAKLFHGDLGTSILTGQPVGETISTQLPASVVLAVLAFLVTVVVAVPLGVVSATLTRGGRMRPVETTLTTASVLLLAVPSFLFAEALVYVFSIRLGWFPIAGQSGPSSYVLPVLSLSSGSVLFFARLVRVEVLAVMEKDFVRTARAKRLPGWRVMVFDVLPNSLTSTLTLGGLLLTGLVASTVFVEQVFSWPGLGSTLVSSIQGKDFPAVQGIVLVYGTAVLLVNFVVDLVLTALDPRPAGERGRS